MKKLSIAQRKAISNFFVNGGVGWFSGGVIVPFFAGRTIVDFLISIVWGVLFALSFLAIGLVTVKGIKS